MNIFYLDHDPKTAAEFHCDKHVPKMIVETAQMLCTAYHINGYHKQIPYKKTHWNHPCSKWVRESNENFQWTIQLGEALCDEFEKRFNKPHKSRAVINWCKENALNLPNKGFTSPALAMPDEYKNSDPIVSYRNFYMGSKKRFAKWERSRNKPNWYTES